MPYPSIGPDPTNAAAARMYLDDGHLPSRGVLISEPDMATGDHAQAHENAYRAAMLAEARVGSGWIPSPVGADGLSPVTFPTVGTPTATVTTMIEQTVVASADVSAWLRPGIKFRCTDGGTRKDFIVTAVSGGSVTLLGRAGSTLTVIDNGSVFYGPRPADFSYNPDEWACSFIRTTDTTEPAPTPGAWYATGSPVVHVPAGLWAVEFRACVEVNGQSSQALGVSAGLSTAGNSDPLSTNCGDLKGSATIQPASTQTSPVLRQTFTARAVRNLTVPGTVTNFSLNCSTGSANVANIIVRGTLVWTIIRATSLYL